MNHLAMLGAACAGVLVHAAVAAAQGQPGATYQTGTLITRAPASVEGTSTTAAREATRQFGECSLKDRPRLAKQVIDLPFDSPEFTKTLAQLVTDDCLASGELSMPRMLLRGALFEAIYKREFGRDYSADLKSVPPFNYAAGYSPPIPEEASNVIALAIVGDCVTRSDSASVRALVNSLPGTPAESKAISSVTRWLPGCVPPRLTVRFSRSVIRAAAAEALYRLSKQQRKVAAQ